MPIPPPCPLPFPSAEHARVGPVVRNPGRVRHIHRGSVSQWHVPGIKNIECASTNESQIRIALVGGELIYFELDAMSSLI